MKLFSFRAILYILVPNCYWSHNFHFLLLCHQSYCKIISHGSHFCGVPDEDVKFNVKPLLFGRLSLTANIVGGKKDTEAMLQFAADHQCLPIIEIFPHSQAAEALQKVRDGSIRFRAVLENDIADGKRKSPPS
jgi:hypothetical protein